MQDRMQVSVLLLVLVSIFSLLLQLHKSRASMAKPACQEKCGNLTVVYPFGIGEGCYWDKAFEVKCNSSDPFIPLRSVQGLPILEISLDSVRGINEGFTSCRPEGSFSWQFSLTNLDPRFTYSHSHNTIIGMGCSVFTYITDSVSSVERSGCVSLCNNTNPVIEFSTSASCSGINGCCQAALPGGLRAFDLSIATISMYNESRDSRSCSIAFVAEKDSPGLFTFNTSDPNGQFLFFPVVFNWVIENITCHDALQRESYSCSQNGYCIDSTEGPGYRCSCLQGYQGNPYLPNGCQDINECEQRGSNPCQTGYLCVNTPGSYHCTCPPGYISDSKGRCRQDKATNLLGLIIGTGIGTASGLLLLGTFGDWLYRKHKTRKKNKIKCENFERNGGLLLQQQNLFSSAYEIKLKHYLTEDMEKATENFNASRILGKGGDGTVYKGMLTDGSIVAIKKSNVIDEGQLSRFINEVFILSQINHRNIVKLLGCCLEYEVPLLVYEYVSNGPLSYHLHNDEHVSTLVWGTRLRIASEVAGALAYLHSYASIAIFHRDVKSGNILLDKNLRAVVSDFGLSKPVSVTNTHITTLVGGTFGYLDPDYFRTGKLTDKSDVYAFGVVLAELLTGRRAAPSKSSDEGLAQHFKCLMKQDCLFKNLETLVVNGGTEEEIVTVAKLAKRCLEINSKRRPSMKEVAADLDRLRSAVTEGEDFAVPPVLEIEGQDYILVLDGSQNCYILP